MAITDETIGARLQEARKAVGFTQTEVAEKIGLAVSTISEIEHGKRRVSEVELYEFARLYVRPLDFFLEDQPRQTPAFQYLFREADEDLIDRQILVTFEELCRSYQQLEELVGVPDMEPPPDYSAFGFRTTADAETLAVMERARLGLEDAPIRDLASLLDERAGVRVFLLPVKRHSFSGVVTYDRVLRPCMGVNGDEIFYRRNFIMAHEYVHCLVDLTGEKGPLARIERAGEAYDTKDPRERFANAFAAAFLMPRKAVNELYERLVRERDGHFIEDLVHLAMYFGVSGEAMAYRLISLRKLGRSVWDSYKETGPTFQSLTKLLGYQPEDSEEPMTISKGLPRRYRYLAYKAYKLGIISFGKLAEFLRENYYDLKERHEAAAIPDRDHESLARASRS